MRAACYLIVSGSMLDIVKLIAGDSRGKQA
jgi:hypothetical protein